MRGRAQRAASELEHAVVYPKPQRTGQRHLHASSRVEGEAGVLMRAQLLAIQAGPRRHVRLQAKHGKWCLKQDVATPGHERWGGGLWVVRYATVDTEDRFGGSVVLASVVNMKNYREGDLVTVHGNILKTGRASKYLGGALYRAEGIDIVERSDPRKATRSQWDWR